MNFTSRSNGGALVDCSADVIRKETSGSFELGFRSSLLDGNLQINGAVFQTDVDDMQFFEFFVGPFGLLRTAENIDEVSLSGFELSAAWAVTDNLRIDAGYSAVDGEIDVNNLRPYTAGNEVPNNPEFTANAAINIPCRWVALICLGVWNIPIRETRYHTVQDDVVPATLFGGPPANFGQTDGQGGTMVNGYGLTNVRIEGEERWSITAFARNWLMRNSLQK